MLNVTELLAVLAKSRAFINVDQIHGMVTFYTLREKAKVFQLHPIATLVDACANGPSLLTPTPELRKAYDHEDNITC